MARAIRSAAVLAAVLWSGPAAHLEAQDRPGTEVVIRWPDPESPRLPLQDVLDAAPDGAIVRLAAGVYQTGPLFVRDKALTIEGAGCDERPSDADPRRPATTQDRPRPVTHLVGPAATEVIPAERATGVVNYVRAGGILRGVKLSGLDAGIVGRDADVGGIGRDLEAGGGRDPRARPLFVRESCVTDSARGVLWFAPALLTVNDTLIRNVLWNGFSIVGPGNGVHLADVGVAHAQNSCAFFVNTTATVKDSPFFFCGESFGIAAVGGSLLTAQDSFVWVAGGPGIYLEESTGDLTHNTVLQTTIAGILVVAGALIGQDNDVFETFEKNGFFGDGILVFASGAILHNNDVAHNTRAGVSNFGSHVIAQSNRMSCNGFDLAAEPVDGTPHLFLFQNAGDNSCGCPDPVVNACVAQSSGLLPPEPLQDPQP